VLFRSRAKAFYIVPESVPASSRRSAKACYHHLKRSKAFQGLGGGPFLAAALLLLRAAA